MHERCRVGAKATSLAAFAFVAFAAPLLAVDGVIEINQTRALAGGVTPDDTPGFPVTISEAGSYRLTGNLEVPDANTHGINIPASSVTIDLNGFEIAGPVICGASCASTGSGQGIRANGSRITVTNGTVRGMGSAGLFLSGENLVDRVRVLSNGTEGMDLGSQSVVTRSIAERNGRDGIRTLNTSVMTNNVAFQNLGDGLFTGAASTVSGNSSLSNGGDGIQSTGTGSSVVGNNATSNTGFGLNLVGTSSGYANNVLNGNNGGIPNPQVNGGLQMGTNVCGGDTTCP